MTGYEAQAHVCETGERAQPELVAWLRGVTEALSVLTDRTPAERQRAAVFAVTVLAGRVPQADWRTAGLPPVAASQPQDRGQIPIGHEAVLRLAQAAMQLYAQNLPHAQRPQSWARLAAFLSKHVPAADPRLGRLHEMALNAQVLAGDVSDEVIKDLTRALERHGAEDGQDAYMTGIARTNLAVAFRVRAAGIDLAEATTLAAEEAVRRTARYGATHPVTLVARSEYVRSLLAQADAAADRQLRHSLAGQALEEASQVRMARDRLYGFGAPNAIRSRRHEGHALLLLDELDKARGHLQCALAFDTRSNQQGWHGRGSLLLLLARADAALGELSTARELAKQAKHVLARDAPAGSDYQTASSLLQKLGDDADNADHG
jgi:hypothetical protein